jgi:hypothetical protein
VFWSRYLRFGGVLSVVLVLQFRLSLNLRAKVLERRGPLIQNVMASPPNSGQDDGEQQYTTLTVTPEFRDAVRVAKAEQGLSYEAYLRQHVPVGTDD